MYLNVNFRLPIARECETDFVIPQLVDIFASGSFAAESPTESANEYLVGRLWAERMDWFLAKSLGYQAVNLCDAASATWLQVYETLVSRNGRAFRKDLQLDGFVNEIVFIHEFLLHPDIDDRLPWLDAAIQGISGMHSLVLMHFEQESLQHLQAWEFRELGFKKIARSNVVMRNGQLRYPFGDAHTGGKLPDFTATAEHQEWLLDHWDNLISDPPVW